MVRVKFMDGSAVDYPTAVRILSQESGLAEVYDAANEVVAVLESGDIAEAQATEEVNHETVSE